MLHGNTAESSNSPLNHATAFPHVIQTIKLTFLIISNRQSLLLLPILFYNHLLPILNNPTNADQLCLKSSKQRNSQINVLAYLSLVFAYHLFGFFFFKKEEVRMASEQLRRDIKGTDERAVDVEKDKVPKLTTHFESLVTQRPDEEKPHQFVSISRKVEGVGFDTGAQSQEQREGEVGKVKDQIKGAHEEARKNKAEEAMGKPQEGASLEELTRYRQQAQQKSVEAIRAAEERSQRAKDAAAENAGKVKESAQSTAQSAAEKTKGQVQSGTQMAAQKTGQAKDYVMQGVQTGTQMGAERAGQAKDYAAEKLRSGSQIASEKTGQAKDTIVQGVQSGTQFAAEKTGQAKDSVVHGVQSGTQVASEKAKALKDTVVETGQMGMETAKQATGYTVDKAAQAKDTTVDVSIKAAGYIGEKTAKVAGEAVDYAAVAGWEAAHFTAEKAAQATKAVAGVAVAAKDKLAGAGQTVAGFTESKLAAAKDVVVSTEESAAEYAARKKAEAQRDLEQKKKTPPAQEGGFVRKEERLGEEGGRGTMPTGKVGEYFQEESGQEQGQQEEQIKETTGGGVLHAIGETIVEIGQTAKDLLVGQGLPVPGQPQSYKEEETTEEEQKVPSHQAS